MGGFKTFTAETLTVDDVNNLLMRQTVPRVATVAALLAIPSPEAGMMAYCQETANVHMYNGSAWWRVLNQGAKVGITYRSGYKNFSPSYPAAVIIRNSVAYLSGLVAKDGSNFAASTTFGVADIPAQYRPVQNVYAAGMTSAARSGAGVVVTAAGAIEVRTYEGVSAEFVGLDSICWPLG
jgi:hypothetical protein